jgi:hypothetical protein
MRPSHLSRESTTVTFSPARASSRSHQARGSDADNDDVVLAAFRQC